MKRNGLLVAILGFAALVGTSGCRVTYGTLWYDVYGRQCGYSPRPGCNFYRNGGFLDKINMSQDPYYSSSYYGLTWDVWFYYDSFGYPQTYIGWAWESPNGILYNSFGSALNSTGDSEVSPDVVADAAVAEETEVRQAGSVFAERHALAEDVGIKIARTLNHWANIGKTRERTKADVEYVSKQLFGLNMKSMEKAWSKLESGDKSAAEDLSVDVAKSWGTTPETTREILRNWYSAE